MKQCTIVRPIERRLVAKYDFRKAPGSSGAATVLQASPDVWTARGSNGALILTRKSDAFDQLHFRDATCSSGSRRESAFF